MAGKAAGATAGAGTGAGTASAGAGAEREAPVAGHRRRSDGHHGFGGGGSASAVGALKINAATIPSAADTTSCAVSLSILTDAPFPFCFEPVLLGASAWLPKLLHLWLL